MVSEGLEGLEIQALERLAPLMTLGPGQQH